MMRKRVLNSPRLKSLRKKKREGIKKKVLIAFGIFFCTSVVVVLLARLEKVKIQTVEITGNRIIEMEEVEELVKKEISGNFYFFFPKANFLFLPKESINEKLKKSFSRIKELDIKIEGLNTLRVEITEYEGAYLWCGEEPLSDTETRGCYYLDEEGYIFDTAPYFSGEIFTKFFGKLNKERDTIGQYFLENYLDNLMKFKELATLAGVEPVSFHLDDGGDVNMYLTSRTLGLGPKIIFKKDSPYKELAENLDTIMSTDSFQKEFIENYADLLYIDLRFGNKVYYKFSEE